MGKHIIRATHWSGRSLLRIYSRLMTLIFALFCTATGQMPKTKSSLQAPYAPTTFRGTAYRATDSTVLSNVRLFLRDCLYPEYGIYPDYGIEPEYGVIAPLYGISPLSANRASNLEELTTYENGTFEIDLTGTSDIERTISSEVVTENDGQKFYNSPECVTIQPGTDSIYSLYLNPVSTAVAPRSERVAQLSLATVHLGEELQIRIPEWNGEKSTARIVTTRGRNAATLTPDADGILHWDTRTVAKGVYFLRLQHAPANLSVKLLVK